MIDRVRSAFWFSKPGPQEMLKPPSEPSCALGSCDFLARATATKAAEAIEASQLAPRTFNIPGALRWNSATRPLL
eukprot:6473604-Amphidinium_carterae.1